MDTSWRRIVISLVLLAIGSVGWLLLGGWLFAVLILIGAGSLTSTWIVYGANDMYGPRTKYPVAEDLVRADDDDQPGPHPGPLPPQPPGW